MKEPTLNLDAITTIPSPEAQAEFLAQARAIDTARAARRRELKDRWEVLKAEVAEFIGYKPFQHTGRDAIKIWMTKGPLEGADIRTSWVRRLEDRINGLKEKAKRDEEQKRQKAVDAERAARPAFAVAFLVKHGQTPGVDFDPARAVDAAESLAMRLAIEKCMAEGGPFAFGGSDDCDSGCQGWDGESHRCQCGNRRVSWATWSRFEDFDTGNFHIYAEAN